MNKIIKGLIALMIACLTTITFIACAVPSNPAKAMAKLEENGYKVVTVSPSSLGLDFTKIETILVAANDNASEETVTIIYYKDAEDAKAKYDELRAEYRDNDDDDFKFGRSGKAIYYGHKSAIRAC